MTREDVQISDWDTAEFLDSDEMITEYLQASMENGNEAFLNALSVVARAKGMTDLAQKTGLARESIYKALRPESKPRYETIAKIMSGLGLKLQAVPV